MAISLIIDTSGGSNFEANDLRNVGSLHVGGTALATETLDVTGTVGISSTLKVNTIAEFTAATGVTIDGVLIKDSKATVDSLLAGSNDSGALGASGTAFSDLFLASGAVINFNAGDVTITHSASTLTVVGTITPTVRLLFSTDQLGGAGSIYKSATEGLVIQGIAGSSNVLVLGNVSGGRIMYNPAGGSGLDATFGGKITTIASGTARSGLVLPHGVAPTSPVNGDIWTTTAGLYVRINGATVGPLS